MRNASLLLGVTLALLVSTVTFAQEEKKYGDIKFSGVLYSFYYMNLSSTVPIQNSFPQEKSEPLAKNFNQFDIERIYLNIASELSEKTRFRVTTDIYRNAAAAGVSSYVVSDTHSVVRTIPSSYYNGIAVRLKYGYFDWLATPDLMFRFGLQQTPWFDGMEKAWKYRGVQQTAADKNGFISSADLGFSANYSFPDKYGSASAYIFNGGGYSNPEFNRFKDVALRLEVSPMPTSDALKGLKLAGFTYMGSNQVTSTDPTSQAIKHNVTGFMLGFTHDMFSIGAEYDMNALGIATTVGGVKGDYDSTNTQSVLSVFGELKAPGDWKDQLALFLRLDMFKPTDHDVSAVADNKRDATNTKNTLIIAGLAWKASSKVTIAADYQGTSFEKAIATEYGQTAKSTSDNRFFIHGIVGF